MSWKRKLSILNARENNLVIEMEFCIDCNALLTYPNSEYYVGDDKKPRCKKCNIEYEQKNLGD